MTSGKLQSRQSGWSLHTIGGQSSSYCFTFLAEVVAVVDREVLRPNCWEAPVLHLRVVLLEVVVEPTEEVETSVVVELEEGTGVGSSGIGSQTDPSPITEPSNQKINC